MNQRRDKKRRPKKTKIIYESSSSYEDDDSVHMLKDKDKKKSRQRVENSLGELTKNFINYIRDQGQKEININELVKKLKVKKRRIYDITNVLEGIGYIRKIAKNKVLWLKDDLSEIKSDEDEQKEIMIQEIEKLEKEEENLDYWIESMKSNFEKLTEDADFKQYGYVTFDDIKSLTNGENINLIAIKAPPGTSLDIPDPDMIHNIYLKTKENMETGKEMYDQSLLDSLEKKYQLFLDSPNGEINVYLVLNKEEENKKNLGSYSNVLRQNKSFKNKLN